MWHHPENSLEAPGRVLDDALFQGSATGGADMLTGFDSSCWLSFRRWCCTSCNWQKCVHNYTSWFQMQVSCARRNYRVAISKMNALKQQLHHCLVSTPNLLMLWPTMIVFCLLSCPEAQSHFRKFQGVAHCWDHETTFLPRLFLSKASTPWLSGAAKSGCQLPETRTSRSCQWLEYWSD